MITKPITIAILDRFDEAVRELSKDEYKETLEDVIDALKMRLECVEEEMEEEEGDEA